MLLLVMRVLCENVLFSRVVAGSRINDSIWSEDLSQLSTLNLFVIKTQDNKAEFQHLLLP